MNANTLRAAVAILLLASSSIRAADPTDPAELFPPGTLAYVELHDPATAGPQIAAAFKGSQLEDSIAYIHQRREKSKDPRDHFSKEQLAVLGLIASPEMAAEFKRLRGLAVGVVGINEQGESEYAVAVLTGESSAAGLAARAFLTLTSLRKVAAVGDVPVYQFKQPAMGYDPNGRQTLQNDKPPPEGAYEPTFAYLPGLFVAGTSKKAISEVIARFQGKAKDSLATVSSFKESAAAHRKPGLFFFANVPEFCARLDEVKKKSSVGMEMEPDALGWFKVLVNAKATRAVSGNLAFRDGGLAVTFGCNLEPGQKSPLLDALSGPGVKIALLRHTPCPATFAFAVAFPEQNRAAAILGFLDGLAKANGSLGRTPSEAVKELEEKLKKPISATLLARTKAATVILPVKQDLPKGAVALPLVVLHTESPEVAVAWDDFLPKLLGDMGGGDAPQVAMETIDGLKVSTLPGGNLPWKSAVHYARKDGTVAIGQDRKLVAAAAKGEAAAPSLAVPTENASLAGSLGAGGLVRLLTEVKKLEGPVVPRGPATPAKVQPNSGFGQFGGPGGFEDVPTLPGTANLPEKQQKSEDAAKEAFFKALDALPPASFTMKRAGNDLRIEMFQPKLQGGGMAPLINSAVGWFDQVLNRYSNPNGYGGRYQFRGGW